jgi:hypothetical protein
MSPHRPFLGKRIVPLANQSHVVAVTDDVVCADTKLKIATDRKHIRITAMPVSLKSGEVCGEQTFTV